MTTSKSNLTPRENDVLKLLAEGWTRKEIGEQLFLSKRTVDGYLDNMLKKYDAKNSNHLISMAFREGWLV